MDYYSTHFGMRVLRGDAASGAAVMGFGSGSFAVELLQHADAPGGGRGGALDLGSGFGHFGLAAKDVYALCDTIKAQGGKARHTPLGDADGGQW